MKCMNTFNAAAGLEQEKLMPWKVAMHHNMTFKFRHLRLS